MPQKLCWTPPQDAQIRRLRGEGATWDRIAAALAVSRYAAIERGRLLGAQLPPPEDAAEIEARYLRDPAREPLPPGHDVSWGAITCGSCLDGAAYGAAIAETCHRAAGE